MAMNPNWWKKDRNRVQSYLLLDPHYEIYLFSLRGLYQTGLLNNAIEVSPSLNRILSRRMGTRQMKLFSLTRSYDLTYSVFMTSAETLSFRV